MVAMTLEDEVKNLHPTLLRVVSVPDSYPDGRMEVTLPGVYGGKVISIRSGLIPDSLRSYIRPEEHFIVTCDLSEEDPEKLYFGKVELAPTPDDNCA